MKAKVSDQFGGKIIRDNIKDLESFIGKNLPRSFVKFLLKNNGGRPEPNGFKTNGNEIISQIQFFFGITADEIYDLKTNFNKWIYRNRPAKFFPIAIDVIGNIVVIDLSDNSESLFLWIHDSLETELILIDVTFDNFLSDFFKIDIEETEVDLAIERQDIQYFKNRIDRGENIDDICNDLDQKVVLVAALRNKIRLLQYFSSQGANMNLTLFNAASNGHLETVKYLLSLNLNINERNIMQNNDTPLIQAAFGGYLNIVKELIEAGADLNAKDKFNQSVLTKAVWSDNQELVSYLESKGASL